MTSRLDNATYVPYIPVSGILGIPGVPFVPGVPSAPPTKDIQAITIPATEPPSHPDTTQRCVQLGRIELTQGNYFQVQLEYDEKEGRLIERRISNLALPHEYENLRKVLHECLQVRSTTASTTSIEISLHGYLLSRMEYDVSTRAVRTVVSNPLSFYDLRLLNQYGKDYVEKLKARALIPPPEALPADLHTHFGGALSSKMMIDAIRNAQHPVLYPVNLLKEMRIPFLGAVDAQGNIDLSDKKTTIMWEQFAHLLMMNPMRVASFTEMEDVYRFRGPIVKNLKLFPHFLKALAEEYKTAGVKYVELSISDVVKPEWMEVILKTLPEIEKTSGVKIRFLVSIWRHSPRKFIEDMLDQIMAYRYNPYIVGVDIMGHETNSTRDFIYALDILNEYKKLRPDLVVRVHAGESPCHPENIILAIKHGATRIGHGLHGITAEVFELARKYGVTFEFNISSNLSLNSAVMPGDIPIKKYIEEGVSVTIGTDGQGCYGTTHQMEALLALFLGLERHHLEMIRKWDLEYMERMAAYQEAYLKNSTTEQLLPVMPKPNCPPSVWKKAEELRKTQRQDHQISHGIPAN